MITKCLCGCGQKVTHPKTYVDKTHYPSKQKKPKSQVVGKIKVCLCPDREFYMDHTHGYVKKFAFGDACRLRLMKHTGEWKNGAAKMPRSHRKDKPFRNTVCVGKGVDGKGISRGVCGGRSKCSDSLCDGGLGLYEFEKNGQIDCWHKDKTISGNTLGCGFAVHSQNKI